jgi:DNA-binding GntR family transcriptional regulator
MPLRVRIAAQLRNAILAGEFKEGQSLSLTDISTRLGISRTPVREAFQTLAAEGFIELRMNKHALVRGIGLKFIRDHYQMRILLEGEAVYCAACNRMDTSELAQLTGEVKSRLPDLSSEVFTCYNQCFHVALWEAADNRLLEGYLMGLWNGPSKGRTVSNIDHYVHSIREHEEIIAAIAEGRGEDARRCMHDHVSRGFENMVKSYQLL